MWSRVGNYGMNHDTREAWLRAATVHLRPIVDKAGALVPEVQVSCGWPARGALARSKRRVGECWHGSANKDGQSHVFVSPCLDNAVEVVGCLLHELIHASLPLKVKHGRAFAKLALACGLEGKPTATTVGSVLAKRINAEILPALGPYPHQAIDASNRPKQKTRMLLWVCQCEPPVKVRAAARSRFNATCNECGTVFAQPETNDTED